jgi:hypothetical protein
MKIQEQLQIIGRKARTNRYCECGGMMKRGIALQSVMGARGVKNAHEKGYCLTQQTAVPVLCLKCSKCGHSITWGGPLFA